MKKLKEVILLNSKIRAKELINELPNDFFDGEKESSKIIYASKAITWTK
jgi:hypothetical protein